MNKKELIKLLDKYEIEYEITDNTKEVEEGLRLLDEALEKIGIIIPKEIHGDLISRQAAIDTLVENMPQAYTPDGSHPADKDIFMAQEIYADCIQMLKLLPPVEPERPKGEWIFKTVFPNDKSEFPMGYLVCPVCGSRHRNSTPCNYCDNCGADMRGDKE